MAEAEATLLFRHLPAELNLEDRKDLLHSLGASRVKVMGQGGPMKNTAFAVFASKGEATKILNQLHQVEFLGSTLVVEFAKKQLPVSGVSVVDNEGKPQQAATDDDVSDAVKEKVEPQEVKFDTTFNVWGVKHPRRPELRYLYPPPTPSILANIMNALAAVPKFYVQVLHLMNKMDLPAPFGPVTSAPPVRPDTREVSLPDDIDQREMEISSETESELESDEDGEKKKRLRSDEERKRPPRPTKKRITKRPRLSDLHDSGILTQPSAPSVQVSEVFEQMADGSSTKKIELRLPSSIVPQTNVLQFPQVTKSQPVLFPDISVPPPPLPHQTTSDGYQSQIRAASNQPQPVTGASSLTSSSSPWDTQSHRQQQDLPPLPSTSSLLHHHDISHQQLQHPPPPLPVPSQEPVSIEFQPSHLPTVETQHQEDSAIVVPGGFGIIKPVHKETEKEQEENSSEKEFGQNPNSSLHQSLDEADCLLQDIHWIYGRYVDWDSEMETNIFDIRLMKEGRMKGQAFVTLPSEKVAVSALKDTNGFVLKDKPMVVQFARTAKAQEDGAAVK